MTETLGCMTLNIIAKLVLGCINLPHLRVPSQDLEGKLLDSAISHEYHQEY